MNSAEIEIRLVEFLREQVFGDEIEVTTSTDLIASGFDSMSLAILMLHVEQTFGIWIPENELNEHTVENVRSLAALVIRLANDQTAPG